MDDLDRMIYRAAKGCEVKERGGRYYACDGHGCAEIGRVVAMALISRRF
jgi:hypothetical protein